jgi:hypothetical protein
VDEVVPQSQALAAALTMAERVAALPPVQLRICKEGINLASGALHLPLNTIDREQCVLAQSSDDYQEGVCSFLEKRRPVFRGRGGMSALRYWCISAPRGCRQRRLEWMLGLRQLNAVPGQRYGGGRTAGAQALENH